MARLACGALQGGSSEAACRAAPVRLSKLTPAAGCENEVQSSFPLIATLNAFDTAHTRFEMVCLQLWIM